MLKESQRKKGAREMDGRWGQINLQYIIYLHATGNELVKRDKFVQETGTVRGAVSLRRETMGPSVEGICLTFDRSKVNVLTQERRQNKW